MTTTNLFWVVVGFMAGLAATFFVLRMMAKSPATLRVNPWVLASAVVFLVGAVWIYSKVGRPDALSNSHAPMPPAHASGEATQAGSMQEVIAKLVTKLASGSGSDADWQLLQQSYEFLGDTAGAAAAAQRQLPADALMQALAVLGNGSASTPPADFNAAASADADRFQQQAAQNPRDAAAWRGLAEASRSARQFQQAVDAYEKLMQLKAMSADDWANRADAAASLHNTLDNELTRRALEQALKLNPRHAKALWLKASWQLEQHQYAAALKTWQTLRAQIPDDSPDARIIDANIAEAQSLTGAGATNAKSVAHEIKGNVTVESKESFAGATLYVFARADDSPAPVAVYKTTITTWPIAYVLNDAQAMMPTRKLSQYQSVSVQARISRSGSALAQPGDWQSKALRASVGQAQTLALVINQPVTAQVSP